MFCLSFFFLLGSDRRRKSIGPLSFQSAFSACQQGRTNLKMIDKLGVAVLVSLFTRSSAYAIIPATQRAAAAAPRFDHFCDSILGQWHCTKDRRIFEVEEVMRSCGGAVQGVREKEGALYHNRADDGFVYFGCGTYSSGPLSLSSEGVKLTTNLCFPSHRQRVTLE